jgi:hypothetical protein
MSDSLLDQMKAFGAKLGLPKVDVDKLVEMNRKNLDALVRSASVAGEGAKAFAGKQREIMQAAFKEASAMVKDFHCARNCRQAERIRQEGVRGRDAEHARFGGSGDEIDG